MFSDTALDIPGGSGAPTEAKLWAVNKSSGRQTRALDFSNYYDPDYLVIITSISDTIGNIQTAITNQNAKGNEEKLDESNPDNKNLLKNADKAGSANNLNLLLYIGIAVVALVILVGVAIRRKKSKP